MTPAEADLAQRALLAGAVVVVGWVVALEIGRRADKRRPEVVEKDHQIAMRDPRREKIVARRSKPEWQRRIEAYWRLGEVKRTNKRSEAK